MKLFIIILLVGVDLQWSGCDAKVNAQRSYDRKGFIGDWQGETATITNSKRPGEQIRISVPRYGTINCHIDSVGTFTLDVAIYRNLTFEDDEGWMSIRRVLVNAGYKVFIAGTYEYEDSVADFCDYDRQKHFRSVLYTYAGKFYLTYTDEKGNEWKLQFEKAN